MPGDTVAYGAATHCNTLQHTATHCNTLQHTATHCNTLQHAATHCNTLQHTATHCNTLQHTARHCNTLQDTATRCNTLQHTATRCNTRQHTATHCNTAGGTVACEPAYTSFHGTKGVTVDYIWVSPQVQVVGVWEVLAAPLLEAPHSRLANGECPEYLQKSPISPRKKPYIHGILRRCNSWECGEC